jgi:hypothetical protein
MGSTTPELSTDSFHQIGQVLKALQDYGVTLDHLGRLRSDKRYTARVANLMRFDWVDEPPHHTHTRNSMGQAPNFFGPLDWMRFYGIVLGGDFFTNIPWSVETLLGPCPFTKGKKVHQTHFLFFTIEHLSGENLNIDQLTYDGWYMLHRRSGRGVEARDGHQKCFPVHSQANPRNKPESTLRWHLVCMHSQRSEGYANFDAREMSLPGEYEVASAVDVVAMFTLYYRLSDTRAGHLCTDFTASLGQCCDRHGDGDRSEIRIAENKVIQVRKHSAVSDLGVFASRKFPTA